MTTRTAKPPKRIAPRPLTEAEKRKLGWVGRLLRLLGGWRTYR